MHNLKFILLLGLVVSTASQVHSSSLWNADKKDTKGTASCRNGYDTCNLGIDGMINVHIVPHTHDDVGWLKTVDQYYYGSNNNEQTASVQYILDTVITELAKDPKKRFVYVEMAFLWRWWSEQTDDTKQLVRTLVNEGRLEFVIGAWCMADEASTYYQDLIDQQSLGLQFILREFGECARPKTAWQVDPFGHSREQASLFAQFGYDGLFLGRIDYQDSDERSSSLTREMIWNASASLGSAGQIFTGILPNTYNPPDGFCFDIYCGDDPMMDNPNLEDYNVDKKVAKFLKYTLAQASIYKTKNLIMTMGSDFQFSNAHMWYKNLDKLIFYINQQQLNGSKVNIFYSTPACFLYSLYKSGTKWPVKGDDFFPYAHRPHAFWTGYFTSRIALKGYVRRSNNFLQAVRQLSAFAKLSDDYTRFALDELSRAMGVAQHHDAVSGTERQHVADDYAKRLAAGTDHCLKVVDKAYGNIAFYRGEALNASQSIYCPLLNISECLPIEGAGNVSIVVYNPLARANSYWMRVPVLTPGYTLYDATSKLVLPSEVVEVSQETKRIPDRKSKANYEVLFRADLPPLAFKTFTLKKTSFKEPVMDSGVGSGDNVVLKNQHLSVQFDSSGNLMQIDATDAAVSSKVAQKMCFYKSMPGNNSEGEFQASGAYIFRPMGAIECLGAKSFSVKKGELYSEVHQVFNDWLSQTVRVYDQEKYIEFDWQVGPIDVSDGIGREVVVKFNTDLVSTRTFYTDSNGREMLARVRDYRPTWKLNNSEPVAGNYYPINSRIFIRDETKFENGAPRQFTIVTDRTHGGSSIVDGSVEVMLHRRILHDDALGVSEPLNEPGSDGKGLIVKGKFYVFLNASADSARLHRDLAHKVNAQPLVTFGVPKSEKELEGVNRMDKWRFAKNSLPDNVNLLTLMNDFSGEFDNAAIIRLEHFYELGEDKVLSQPVTVDLMQFFGDSFEILGITELNLGANMKASDMANRLKFNAMDWEDLGDADVPVRDDYKSFKVALNPMEIRTFRIWYA